MSGSITKKLRRYVPGPGAPERCPCSYCKDPVPVRLLWCAWVVGASAWSSPVCATCIVLMFWRELAEVLPPRN